MTETPPRLTETPSFAMDALSDVLRVMRLTGGVFLNAEFTDPWCLRVRIAPSSCAPYLGPHAYLVAYHFELEGRKRVRMPGGAELDVEAGQSVLFPHNDPHLLGSDLDLTPVDAPRPSPVRADPTSRRCRGSASTARAATGTGTRTR